MSTTLTSSGQVCSGKGEPPFTVMISHKLIKAKAIWALVDIKKYWCVGIEVRDPTHYSRLFRRIGPVGTYDLEAQGDRNIDQSDFEDSSMIRLEPSQVFGTMYTFSVTPKLGGLRSSDVRNLNPGKTYYIMLRPQRWRWMFEDDMEENSIIDHKRQELYEQPLTE